MKHHNTLIERYLSWNISQHIIARNKNGHIIIIIAKQIQGGEGRGIAVYQGPELRIYLSNPITGCKAPARRTSFFILGEEWTKLPITPT